MMKIKAELKENRILVTGGAGFIGANLCEALLALENKVLCLDNFITGKKENISHFIKNNNFQLIEGDIRDLKICREATNGIDYVFHQAALGSVPRSIENPEQTHDININGFQNIILACRDNKVRRLIYASSSSVYGDNPDSPKVEDKTGAPLSPYAVTKQVNELYAKVFSELYGMEIIGLRYFNVFGRFQDPDGPYAAVIPKFVKQLLSGKAPGIHGDGKQSRDFTYVENVVSANILAAVADRKATGNVFNIACGHKTSVNELYSILIEVLSKTKPEIKSIRPVYIAGRKGDIRDSLASIQKARDMLGYSPDGDMRKGIEASIEWYVKNL